MNCAPTLLIGINISRKYSTPSVHVNLFVSCSYLVTYDDNYHTAASKWRS